MGITESREQVTPSRPLRILRLSHMSDPRSPTVGITRTPIEVGNSSRLTPLAVQEVVEDTAVSDPRSPTQGIVRTPLRQSFQVSLNLLAKQLSEVFVAEDSGIEGSPVNDVDAPVAIDEHQSVSEETPVPAPGVKEPEAAEEPAIFPFVPPEAAVELTPPVLQKQIPRGKSPSAAGAKKVRHRNKKTLISAAPGRSPLKILQEDNSPSTNMQNRQLKISFQSEPSSLGNVKILHSSWEMSHNKENALYGQSES
ncbi:cell division cycle-associated protein 3 [Mixophyes fleayi]|uniref:cell division cycle-associated protein 3 n=1 Tax=Mixophyes fleayi TaxID=3061075 RepID=UPI003F4E1AD4